MLELLVVVAIIMVVAAVATPNLMRVLANVRLRAAVGTTASLLQEGRIRAVRDNASYRVIGEGANTTDTNIMCIDLNANGTCTGSTDTGSGAGVNQEPQARLGGTVVLTTSAPPTSVATAAGFGSSQHVIEADKTMQVYFNSRGLPCALSGSLCKNVDGSGKQYAYIYYMTDQRPLYGWAAVTVSPAGRVRIWMYNGSTWEQ